MAGAATRMNAFAGNDDETDLVRGEGDAALDRACFADRTRMSPERSALSKIASRPRT